MNAYAKQITTGPDGSYFTPPEELDAAEVTPEHLEAALEKVLTKDIGGLNDLVNELTFWKEHFSWWVTNDKKLRKDLFETRFIQEVAQEIADNEAAAKREQSAIDDAFEEETVHAMFSPE